MNKNKKYYFVSFTVTTIDHIYRHCETIDIHPFKWLMKMNAQYRDGKEGKEEEEYCIISYQQITHEEYLMGIDGWY